MKQDEKVMFDFAKEKIFKVWGGACDMHSVLKPVHYLMTHMKSKPFFHSLDWLIANNLTGQNFVDFYQETCKGSNLELQRYLTSKIEKKDKRALLAHKDVVL